MTSSCRPVDQLAVQLGRQLLAKGLSLCLAESCTGGGIAQAITDIPGCSAWFDRGFVTYSNAAKIDMLGVTEDALHHFGAVSVQVAEQMATGALLHSRADLAIAVTGIAGPDGGSIDKPIGTVFVAWQLRGLPVKSIRQQFTGDRQTIRQQVVAFCLEQVSLALD